MTVGAKTTGIRTSGTWQPLGNPVFRALWIAVLFSNIGNWMETVGAQWLLVSQPNNSILVALVQTADTLPVVLLALPAGVLADVFDRRLLLIATQLFMAVWAMSDLERSRRRTGASDWQLYRDGADPKRFLEVFEVPSWDTHLRQHGGRLTGADAAIEGRAHALATGPSSVHHYFPADDVPIEVSVQGDAIQVRSTDESVGPTNALSSDDQLSSASSDTTT